MFSFAEQLALASEKVSQLKLGKVPKSKSFKLALPFTDVYQC